MFEAQGRVCAKLLGQERQAAGGWGRDRQTSA